MSMCEVCGKESDDLVAIRTEGAELEACEMCESLGERVNPPEEDGDEDMSEETEETVYEQSPYVDGIESNIEDYQSQDTETTKHWSTGIEEEIEELAFDYDDRITEAREEKGLSQEELAQRLNEKESLITRLEDGRALPSEKVQKKIEVELEISLTETGGKA